MESVFCSVTRLSATTSLPKCGGSRFRLDLTQMTILTEERIRVGSTDRMNWGEGHVFLRAGCEQEIPRINLRQDYSTDLMYEIPFDKTTENKRPRKAMLSTDSRWSPKSCLIRRLRAKGPARHIVGKDPTHPCETMLSCPVSAILTPRARRWSLPCSIFLSFICIFSRQRLCSVVASLR